MQWYHDRHRYNYNNVSFVDLKKTWIFKTLCLINLQTVISPPQRSPTLQLRQQLSIRPPVSHIFSAVFSFSYLNFGQYAVPTTTCSTTTTAQPTTTAPTTFPPGTFCTDWTQAAVLLFVNTTIQKPINVCCFPLCAINTALPNCPYLCWLQPSVPTSFLKVLPMITSIKP